MSLVPSARCPSGLCRYSMWLARAPGGGAMLSAATAASAATACLLQLAACNCPLARSRLWTIRNRGDAFPRWTRQQRQSKCRLEIRYGTMGSWSLHPHHRPSSSTLPSCSRGQLSGCWPCTASVRPPEAYHIRGVLPRRAGPPALPLSLVSCAVSLIGGRLD
jgi:hypothetical protein